MGIFESILKNASSIPHVTKDRNCSTCLNYDSDCGICKWDDSSVTMATKSVFLFWSSRKK